MARRKADGPPGVATPQHRTKSDVAKLHVQEMILAGKLNAGDHVTARAVSEALGMSETPVREAIRSLAAEGWLELQPHLGGVVSSLQSGQLTEIYAIRGALGALGIELGGHLYTDRQLAALDRNLRQSAAVVARGDVARYIALNREFHMLLADTPETQWTLRLLTSLWGQTSVMGRGFRLVPDRLERSLHEHQAILKSVHARDYEQAAALLVEHERLAGAELVAALTLAAAPRGAQHRGR